MKKITILFILFCQCAFASFDMNENMQNSYQYIINLEFEKANDLLQKEQKSNSINGFIPLHQNYINFLTIIITEDIHYFEIAEKKKNNRVDKLKENDKTSPYYLYSQAEVYLQWAFSRLKFEQYYTATLEFIKAYNLLKKNQEEFPDFTLNKKGLGLIHALLGAVPERFHWMLNLAGLQGGIDLGLSELDDLLNDENYKIYENEVLFLLSFLQINLNNNDSVCQKYLDRIGESYKENYLLNFAAARLSHNLGQNDYCLNILENRPTHDGVFSFYYLDYLQGMSYLYKLDYNNAEQKFESFSANFKGVNYIKSAYHKLAWIASLQGDTEKELSYFDKAISEGYTLIDEDKVALKDAKTGVKNKYHIHLGLLRTRLLYDGGYYKKALGEINSVEILKKYSSFYDEYWYRLARIESELNYEEKEVVEHYQKVYDLGQNSTNYYAPMSALQIGLIYEKQNNPNQAEIYLNKCLSLSDFDYERGIHQKAKAALERISY